MNEKKLNNRRCNHRITSCIKSKKITTDLIRPYFISAMFWTSFFSPFLSFNDEKLRYKYCNKRITTLANDNLQSHDQEECKLNSIINGSSSAHIITHDEIMKNPFNENNIATTKSK